MNQPPGSVLKRALDYCYDHATAGGETQGAAALAAEHRQGARSLDESVASLIRWQTAKCAATGFVAGLGGIITIPITLPADLFANTFIQVRMIAAIAHMYGHDVRSDRVRSLVYICLCGNAAADVLKDAGAQISARAIEAALARAAAKGATSNLGKAIPLLGGLISGSVDAAACRLVGETAKRVFRELLQG